MRFRSLSLVLLCFILIIFSGATTFAHGHSETTTQEEIDPTIHISGNSDLLSKAAVNGWPGTGTAEDPIIIQGYRFSSDGHMFTIAFTDLYVNFTNNRVEGMHHTWCCLVISLTKNVIVCNNTIFGGAVGVHLISANNTVITRNTIYDTGFDAVFLDDASTDNLISENHFIDNEEAGVLGWDDCTKNTISNNLMEFGDNGVLLWDNADENYVFNNTITETSISGVDLDSKNNEVKDNRILNCYGDGIRVFKPENEIAGNQIIDSKRRGIYLAPDGNNTEIHHNSFVNNTRESILIVDASGNIIMYNDFLGESERAYASDSGYRNIFEMNFWDGFLAIDENRDGVFDSPYEIEGQAQNRDSYPVTTANNPLPFTSEEPEIETETTLSSTTDTMTTVTGTNGTTTQDNFVLDPILIAAIGVSLIPILIIVAYVSKRK